MKKQNKGITLVALVITIILLLILVGISITSLTGSGLFENARLAEQKSKNAQELEDSVLADFENQIYKSTISSRNEGTSTGISGITENSLLLSLEQTGTAATTHKFSTFTKTPGSLFEHNFEYDSETGDLICKEEGWYIINTFIMITNPGRYNTTTIYGIVNGTVVMKPSAYADAGVVVGRNSDTITIYFKKNDKITFEKVVSAGGTSGTNKITIDIIKL